MDQVPQPPVIKISFANIFAAAITMLLMSAAFSLILGVVIAFIWNLGVGVAFGLHDISGWQGVGIVFLVKLLMFETKSK